MSTPPNILRPVLTVFASVDPPTIIFGLDDENTEGRHDDVINLRATIWRWKHDIVDYMVILPW